jgi:hypothetical protein
MGNDPINGIDPDGGYRTWFRAAAAWALGGFKGSIDHVGGAGNRDFAISTSVKNENWSGSEDNLMFTVQRDYGKDLVMSDAEYNRRQHDPMIIGGIQFRRVKTKSDAILSQMTLPLNLALPSVKVPMPSSSNPSALARASQGKGSYLGIDNWRNITLSEGQTVVGGLPGQSNFYTTLSGLNRSELLKSRLWEGLQVSPHPQFGFRSQVGIYKVINNTPSAFGTTYANSQFGAGGLPQLFIPNINNLQLIKTIPLK